MKTNLPVTQVEKPYPKGKYLTSKTDLKGIVTHANDTFVELSGFSREELIGKNHNLVRHPDMPPQAFEDLWRTVKAGRPWRGIVKNRAKNGDHYWVDAFVVPVRKNDKTIGYMSVRSEPSRQQVQAAEALYKRLNETKAGLDTAPSRLKRLSIRTRIAMIIGFMGLLMLGGGVFGLSGMLMSNQALESVYRDGLQPTRMIGRIIMLMGDNRSQVMLAIRHNPDNSLSKLHDQPVAAYTDRIAKNRDEITAVWAEYLKRRLTPEEKALADQYTAARGAYVSEGLAPARKALLDGNYDQADEILMKKINPLYDAANMGAEALLTQTDKTAKADYQAAVARYKLIRDVALGGTLAGILLAALAGFLLARFIMDPMRRIMGHFDRISQGNLTDEIDISGYDEMGQLLNSLATMQVHLKVMLDEISVAALSIEEKCGGLKADMMSVVEQSEHQHDRVQSVVAAAEEFSQSVVEVAESADGAAHSAVNSQNLVQESNASMSRSMDATGRVVEAVQASSATIGELNQSIEKIGAITQSIKDIADQTNLLALNAAIEAARAGEMGRGFAVVADEVRKLAERTTTSTVDITAMVGEIQKVTRQSVDSMGQAVREVESGTGMMRESLSGLEQITSASVEVAGMARHIADAAKEQAVASEQVAANMEQVSTLIEQNTASAQDAWRETVALSATAESLKVLVGQFELIKHR
ncbi:MAG: methyl-accepting chemotaxis protein [Burkholderiales bacterium]